MYHVDYQCREGLAWIAYADTAVQLYPKLHLELLLSTESSTSLRPSLSCARAREPCYSIIVLLCSTLISASSPESNLRLFLAHTHLSLPLVLRRTLCLSFRRQSRSSKFRGWCRVGPG